MDRDRLPRSMYIYIMYSTLTAFIYTLHYIRLLYHYNNTVISFLTVVQSIHRSKLFGNRPH
jgi:hypothetical protein